MKKQSTLPKKKKQTTSTDLKARIIEIARELVSDKREDIETGVEEGIYDKEENVDNLKELDELDKLITDFETNIPVVYVYVEGGNIQGASASVPVTFNVFDRDNYEQASPEELEAMGTPDEWNDMVDEKTKSGEIVPVY